MKILNHSTALLGGNCDDSCMVSDLEIDASIRGNFQGIEEAWSVSVELETNPSVVNHGLQHIDQALKLELFLGMSPNHHLRRGSIASVDCAAASHSLDDDDSLCWEPIPIGPVGSMNVVKKIDLALGESFQASSLPDSFFDSMSHIFAQPSQRGFRDPGNASTPIPISSVPKTSQPMIREKSVSAVLSSSTTKGRSGSDRWNDRYHELMVFVKRNGHCHVPINYKENKLLSRWTKRQRYQWKQKQEGKNSSMSDFRQALLEDLGFLWDVRTMIWKTRYMELAHFHKKHGHCNVSINCKEFPKLVRQRKGTLTRSPCQSDHLYVLTIFFLLLFLGNVGEMPTTPALLDAEWAQIAYDSQSSRPTRCTWFCWNGKHNGK